METAIVIAIVAIAAVGIGYHLYRTAKGKGDCSSGGCSGCAHKRPR